MNNEELYQKLKKQIEGLKYELREMRTLQNRIFEFLDKAEGRTLNEFEVEGIVDSGKRAMEYNTRPIKTDTPDGEPCPF